MKSKWFMLAFVIAVTSFVFNGVATALVFDFVGPNAQNWFDEFVNSGDTTTGGDPDGNAGWELTENGLTTNNDVAPGHQRIGRVYDWDDCTVETQYTYLTSGAHNEAHLYIRWNNEANNYFIRTIGRGHAGGAWGIEWLRKVGGTNNEGVIGDDLPGNLTIDTIYALRGTIAGHTLTVDFFMDGEWDEGVGETTYPGDFNTGGVGLGRSNTHIAFQHLRVNGPGIPTDQTPVEALGKLATTWGRLKR